FLYNSDALYARLAQSRRGQQATEAAADYHHLDRIVDRFSVETGLDIRIVHVAAEVAFGLDVLIIAFGAQPLVALDAGSGTERVGIETDSRRVRGGYLVSVTHHYLFRIAGPRIAVLKLLFRTLPKLQIS